MRMATAPEVPFHPSQCPQCKFFDKGADRCEGYTTPHPIPGLPPLLAMFIGESNRACPRFSKGRKT
jgi:hypothetical protein